MLRHISLALLDQVCVRGIRVDWSGKDERSGLNSCN